MENKNMYNNYEEEYDYNEMKLEKIKTMPVFAVRMEYENLKAQIEMGMASASDELNQRYLRAYEERLK